MSISVYKDSGLGLVLPAASTESTQKVKLLDDNLTRILVNRDGQVAINNELISLEDLESKVKTIVTKNPEMVFMLKTDRQSRYVHMIDVLDRLRIAGAQRINLSTN